MRIRLTIQSGLKNVIHDRLFLDTQTRLADALKAVRDEKKYWDGVAQIKVWVNNEPKNDPPADISLPLHDNDHLKIVIPEANTWILD